MLTMLSHIFTYTDDMQKGLRPRRSVRNAMSHEIMFYAIVQKEVSAKPHDLLKRNASSIPLI